MSTGKRVCTLVAIALLPLLSHAQAHLDASEAAIREQHPNNLFKSDYANDGNKYIYTKFDYGLFVYYLDSTGISYRCVQVPYNAACINAQAEIYNKKYTRNSDTSWTAYLEDGGILHIRLDYREDYKTSIFVYTSGN